MKLKRTEKEIAFARAQGKAIYNLRKQRGVTRRQLADFTLINAAMIFRIEMGDATASAYDLDAIADALDTSREALFPKPAEVITLPTPKTRRLWAVLETRSTYRRAYA